MGVRKLAEWMDPVKDRHYSNPKDELSEEYSVDEYTGPEPKPEPVAKLHRHLHAVRSDATAPAPVPAPAPAPALALASGAASVPIPTSELRRVTDLSRVIYVRPRSYNEARSIGENYQDGIPVIMSPSDTGHGEDKRLVDFAAGLIFGPRDNIERISSWVFLLRPHNPVVGPKDKQKLVIDGFLNQS